MEDFSDIKCCLKCLCVYALDNQLPGFDNHYQRSIALFFVNISVGIIGKLKLKSPMFYRHVNPVD